MKFQSTLLYLIAAVILIGFYFYETHTGEKKEKAEEEAKRIFQIEPDHLTTITLKKDGKMITLEKSGVTEEPEWVITKPIQAKTESSTVNSLKDTLAGLKYLRFISDGSEEISQFGLDKPVFSISFPVEGQNRSLSFGHRSPIEDGFYAMRGEDKKVYILSTRDKENLDKTVFSLRDKRLFTLETSEVSRVIIDRESGKWILSKVEGDWFFEDDKTFQVDNEKLEPLIRRTIWEEATSFEKEDTDDLKSFGLDKPKARILFSDGKRSEEIILGGYLNKDKKKKIFAKMADRPQIVTVRKEILENLPKTRYEIREKEEKKQEGKGEKP